MKKVIKIAFVLGVAWLCLCIYNDSTPNEALDEVSEYIEEIQEGISK